MGRFTAWEDNCNVIFPSEAYFCNEDVENGVTKFVQYHTYEFNVFKGVVFIKDVTHGLDETDTEG
jgi:hypothetical protein